MSRLVVQYRPSGDIVSWRYEVDQDYQADSDELIADTDSVDHRAIDNGEYKVDTSADPPELVDEPDFETTPTHDELVSEEPVRRAKVSDTTRSSVSAAHSNLQTARSNDNLQGQVDALETIVDVLADIVTGDTLSEMGDNSS
ncbi:hypothetical protein [Natrinema sp. H-ect4]|uniref:hypothetical protein n=1 Tax=Natrinema sp. H-ect4 TaxID=3242699 RepID=UPI0035A97DA4